MISVASGNATSADEQIAAAERIHDRRRRVLGHDLVEPRAALVEVQRRGTSSSWSRTALQWWATIFADLRRRPHRVAAARGDPVQQLGVGDEVGAGRSDSFAIGAGAGTANAAAAAGAALAVPSPRHATSALRRARVRYMLVNNAAIRPEYATSS